MSGFGRRHAWACAPTFQVDFGAPDCTCFCGFLIQVQIWVVFDNSKAIWGLHVCVLWTQFVPCGPVGVLHGGQEAKT